MTHSHHSNVSGTIDKLTLVCYVQDEACGGSVRRDVQRARFNIG